MTELLLHVPDPAAVGDAIDLIVSFGEEAREEAASRSARSRDIGNYIHFCRWRQIERLILLLESHEAVGTVH